jgi:hypothetical protein
MRGNSRTQQTCPTTNLPNVAYILGNSPTEIRRLMRQAALLKPITERLLREAGLAPEVARDGRKASRHPRNDVGRTESWKH